LTFNTTSLPLVRALREKTLLERIPLKPVGEAKRYILVTPEIAALLDGRALFGAFPSLAAEKLIGRFSAGYLVTVSRKVTRLKPDIERIVGFEEVWALCVRTPRPGWRILGRFYERDVFVALRPWEKNHLITKYPEAAREVIDDWQRLFGPRVVPQRSGSVNEYLSGVVRDVDEPF
jgi:hypothetical protein